MNPTPLEYSCCSTYSITLNRSLIALLVAISITSGVLIIYLTGSKVTIHSCQLNFKKTINDPLDYNSNPRSVAIGDFNNDTWLDFVVTNRAVNNISVFLGSTDGTFSRPTAYSTGSYSLPDKVTVADLNNDQRLDVVVAYFGINGVGIFLGTGDGTFVNYTTVSTKSTRPIWIHIAHLDNDTFLDLVTADYGTDSITIYSGDGTGNFSYRMRYPTGYDSSPVSLASGDLNNDNHLDLVVANSGTNSVGIFFGDGNGEFSDQQLLSTGIHSRPNSVAIGHLDNDKLLDIAVANYGTNNVGIFRNLDNGSFGEQTTYMLENASPYFIDVADMNKDKQSDLIITNVGTNNIGILLRRANGDFTKPLMFVTGSLSSISAAVDDLNKDNLPDIVIINDDTNSVTTFFGKDAGFQAEAKYSIDDSLYPTADDVISKDAQSNINDTISENKKKRLRRQYGLEACVEYPWFHEYFGPSSVAVDDFNNDGHLDMGVATVERSSLIVFLGHGNGSFARGMTYEIGVWSFGLNVGDFNADGRPDIVVGCANIEHIYVDILLGYGNGSFGSQKPYPILGWEISIAVGDFNSDNRLDIVRVNPYTRDISILFGNGNGSFVNSVTYPIDSAEVIAVSDVNNDGILDLAVGNSNSYSIDILLGYGNGSFASQIIHPIISYPNSINFADFNSDTIPDIVVPNGDFGTVSILIGFGNGSFEDAFILSTGKNTAYATVGDFNNDDRMDVLVTDTSNNNLRIFLGYGNGSFVNRFTCPTRRLPRFAIVADFNEDGRSDIVVANSADPVISVFIFSQIQFTIKDISSGTSSGSRLKCIATDDFNRDNSLDIAVANYGTKTIALLFGNGDGSFERGTPVLLDWDSNPQSMTIADFNNDKQLDIAVANSGTSSIDMLLGDGTGTLIRQNNDGYRLERPPSIIMADDFNHDGYSEIAVAYENSDNIDILTLYDPGNFTDQITYSTDFQLSSVAMGDFNEDKILDILVASFLDNKIGILFGYEDGSFTNRTRFAFDGDPSLVAVGHFNSDSHLDIVVSNDDEKNVAVLFGYGNGSFTKQKTYQASAAPIAIVVSDLNNDTFSDIVVLVEDTKGIRIFLSYGNGSFAKPRSLSVDGWPRSVTVGDVNNDMFMDIIVSDLSRQINTFLGYGNGSFRTPVRISVRLWSEFVTVGDFNNDTRLDIVIVDRDEGIGIFLGLGNGSFVEHSNYSVGCSPIYAAVADLNNDTHLDIITVNSMGNNITVLLGDGTGSFTSLSKYRTIPSPEYALIGDFNNDARIDIVVSDSFSNTFDLLLGKLNHVFKRQTTLNTGLGSPPQALATGDFNNDTHSDILFLNSHTNTLGVFLGHASGSFSAPIASPTDLSPSLIAVGHLNNDGHLDVVVVHFASSSIGIHLGNGNGSFINHTTLSIGAHTQPKSVSVADFDNDAISDIIIVDYDASNVIVLIGYGNGSFAAAKKTKIGYGTHPFLLAVGDYNNDQKLDFAVGNYDTDNLEIYLQTC